VEMSRRPTRQPPGQRGYGPPNRLNCTGETLHGTALQQSLIYRTRRHREEGRGREEEKRKEELARRDACSGNNRRS